MVARNNMLTYEADMYSTVLSQLWVHIEVRIHKVVKTVGRHATQTRFSLMALKKRRFTGKLLYYLIAFIYGDENISSTACIT